MSDIGDKGMRFFRELRRRKTIRAAGAYILAAWVLIEGASVVLPAFEAPSWILPALIIAVVIGLPVALVLSWIFDLTPEGWQRTDESDQSTQDDSDADLPVER